MAEIDVSGYSLDDLRRLVGKMLTTNPNSDRLWDILTALRGPDAPSERPNMKPKEALAAYASRRERKYRTVEILRERAFFGAVGGVARHHDDDKVTLPPHVAWDHFDKHVARAANAIGIKVVAK